MTNTRTHIELQIQRNPGIHFHELVRSVDFVPGQIQYHVRRLLDTNDIVEEQRYGRTHYYSPTFDLWERNLLALFRRESARDIIGYLLEHNSMRPQTVADDLGIARSTLEWHLGHLIEQDTIVKERDSHNRVLLVVKQPERTRALLKEIAPSIPDRFTRLVDNLLAE